MSLIYFLKDTKLFAVLKFVLFCFAAVLTIAGYYVQKPAKLPKPIIQTFAEAQPEMASVQVTLDQLSGNEKLAITPRNPSFNFFLNQTVYDDKKRPTVTLIGRTVAFTAFGQAEIHSDFQIVAFDKSLQNLGYCNCRDVRLQVDDAVKSHQEAIDQLLTEHQQAEDLTNESRVKEGDIIFWIGIAFGLVTALLDLIPVVPIREAKKT